MIRFLCVLVMLAFTDVGVGAERIQVAAAADLNAALNELATRFEAATGNKVVLSFGASGTLYSQVQNGAPFDLFFTADTQNPFSGDPGKKFDVFFSADEEYPKKLAEAGKIDAASLRTYAIGHLVLWVPGNSKLDPVRMQMNLLTEPSVIRIAIANPQHAPYGRAAIAALEHYALKDRVSGKLVYGENVSQAAQFVQSGNAQAGLIARSLASSPAMASGKYWEVPEYAYPELRQVAGIVTASTQKATAQAFLDFIMSAVGAATLRKYGFGLPERL